VCSYGDLFLKSIANIARTKLQLWCTAKSIINFRDLQRVYFKLLRVKTLQTAVVRPGGNLSCLFVSIGLFAKFVQFSERLFFLNSAIFFPL